MRTSLPRGPGDDKHATGWLRVRGLHREIPSKDGSNEETGSNGLAPGLVESKEKAIGDRAGSRELASRIFEFAPRSAVGMARMAARIPPLVGSASTPDMQDPADAAHHRSDHSNGETFEPLLVAANDQV